MSIEIPADVSVSLTALWGQGGFAIIVRGPEHAASTRTRKAIGR